MSNVWSRLKRFCDKTKISEVDSDILMRIVGEERDRIYRERNIAVAVAAAATYNKASAASRGKDETGCDVIYIDTGLAQFSWHIHSSDIAMFENVVDSGIKWDGSFNGKNPQKAKEVLDYVSRF